jgi:hypothetical protein
MYLFRHFLKKLTHFTPALLILAGLQATASAQDTVAWSKTFTRPAGAPLTPCVDAQDNVYVVITTSYSGGWTLEKLSPSGTVLFTKQVSKDVPALMKISPPVSGQTQKLAVAASVVSLNTQAVDVYEFDTNGNSLWANPASLSGQLLGSAISVSAAGAVTVAPVLNGSTYSFGNVSAAGVAGPEVAIPNLGTIAQFLPMPNGMWLYASYNENNNTYTWQWSTINPSTGKLSFGEEAHTAWVPLLAVSNTGVIAVNIQPTTGNQVVTTYSASGKQLNQYSFDLNESVGGLAFDAQGALYTTTNEPSYAMTIQQFKSGSASGWGTVVPIMQIQYGPLVPAFSGVFCSYYIGSNQFAYRLNSSGNLGFNQNLGVHTIAGLPELYVAPGTSNDDYIASTVRIGSTNTGTETVSRVVKTRAAQLLLNWCFYTKLSARKGTSVII